MDFSPKINHKCVILYQGGQLKNTFFSILAQGVLSNFTNFIQTHFTTFKTKNIQIIEKIPYRFSQKRLGKTFR